MGRRLMGRRSHYSLLLTVVAAFAVAGAGVELVREGVNKPNEGVWVIFLLFSLAILMDRIFAWISERYTELDVEQAQARMKEDSELTREQIARLPSLFAGRQDI